MKFTVLSENRKNGICENEEALSILFEINDKQLLLDTGGSDLFLRNAKLLNIDLNKVNAVILSHGHYDHGGGLKYYNKRIKLICHPDCCLYRRSKRTDNYGGINYTKDELEKDFDLVMTKSPYEIVDNVYFLGEIPRELDFEANSFPMTFEDGSDDIVPDDSGIVIKTENGIIVVSGCAHSGICNTVEYAKKVAKDERVLAVIGGFHLRQLGETVTKTMNYFLDNNIQMLYMGHCNTDEVMLEFENQLGDKCVIQPLYSGAEFEIKEKIIKLK